MSMQPPSCRATTCLPVSRPIHSTLSTPVQPVSAPHHTSHTLHPPAPHLGIFVGVHVGHEGPDLAGDVLSLHSLRSAEQYGKKAVTLLLQGKGARSNAGGGATGGADETCKGLLQTEGITGRHWTWRIILQRANEPGGIGQGSRGNKGGAAQREDRKGAWTVERATAACCPALPVCNLQTEGAQGARKGPRGGWSYAEARVQEDYQGAHLVCLVLASGGLRQQAAVLKGAGEGVTNERQKNWPGRNGAAARPGGGSDTEMCETLVVWGRE